ncbi:phosphatase PAP2 family protein [Xylanimonas allomyrinae]|uniref:Phosphatase PAP2 family protein n=1 Tax=Xylanimonas allomyrinae TaxID=2509459 RepID=A0A4P6EN38_9MICO|nr:phosphatase PAP2 family protein [Xylanimonas allomyrinae]QAY63796.1 phosphatase PAP2 family protein [Xylanimonas allomyrinae]
MSTSPGSAGRAGVVREIALCLGLYGLYTVTRLWASGAYPAAARNALDVLHVEHLLGLDIERAVNHALSPVTWVSVASSYWYATMHFIVTPLMLVLLYRYRHDVYRVARTALMGATFFALLGYFFFPTAPPRLLRGYDYIDTVASTARYGWWPSQEALDTGAGAATNQFAAMPSMHVGWALWVSIVLAVLVRRRWLKVLAFTYVTATTVVVVLTGNHWVLDAVAGGALVAAAWGLATWYERTTQGAREPEPALVAADQALDESVARSG